MKKDVARCPDFQMILKLQQLIVKFGDAHTNVTYLPEMSPYHMCPFRLSCFGNDYYRTSTTKELESLLGSRIIAINGTPINSVEKQFSSLIVADSRSCILNMVPYIMASSQPYDFFDLARRDSLIITIQYGRQYKERTHQSRSDKP